MPTNPVPTPILNLGGSAVSTRKSKLADAQFLFCTECDDLVWSVSTPYFNARQVSHMHKRGTGHALTPLVLDAPVATDAAA